MHAAKLASKNFSRARWLLDKILDGQDLVVQPGCSCRFGILELPAHTHSHLSEIELGTVSCHGALIRHHGLQRENYNDFSHRAHFENSGYRHASRRKYCTPLIGVVESTTDQTVTVAELSSFQLEWIETFRRTSVSS